jgi:thioredoxin 1
VGKNKEVLYSMQTDSIFIILTKTNFRQEVLESTQPVFVEFFTDWCGICHINAPLLRNMALKFRTRIKFCKINVDDYGDIGKEYGVQKIPTMLFFKDGQIMDYIIGIAPRAILVQKLETLLQS